jgi:TolB-like protein/class 3 adenylate cyclase/Tfp pilus assembly protein PilF
MSVKSTAVLVDLVGYSDMSRLLEDSLGVQATLSLNQQVQRLIGDALSESGGTAADNVVMTTGDGALLTFAGPDQALDFATALHRCAARHNAGVTEPRARRIFRVGISTGEIAVDPNTGSPAGMAISRAARLEAKADPGGVLIDSESWNAASGERKAAYHGPEDISGKRDEHFEAYRAQIDPDGKAHAAYWVDTKSEIAANLASQSNGAASQPAGASRRQLMIGGGAALIAVGGGFAAWQTGLIGASAEANSVAVLPFKNLSGDAAQAYFSDGLSEEVRATLARNALLRVAAPTSSGVFRDHKEDAVSIGKQLDVAYLLEGSVRRANNIVRISAELVDTKSGFSNWSQSFDRPIADIFAVQSEIANIVARELAVRMVTEAPPSDPNGKLTTGGTTNVAAYDLFLRGQAFHKLSADEASDRAALAAFDQAIALDPNYAAAHAARSRSLTNIANSTNDLAQIRPLFDASVEAARRAVGLAPDFADAHSALGAAFAFGKLDVKAARFPFERSRMLGVGDADVLARFALFSARCGRDIAAKDAIKRALQLDPLNPRTFRTAATVEYAARRFAESIKFNQKALSLNAKLGASNAAIGDALLGLGKLKEAREAYGRDGKSAFALAGIAIVERAMGNEAAARTAFDALVMTQGDSALYQQAQVFSKWGDIANALGTLQKARKNGDSGLLLSRTDPLLDPLRRNPDFSRLLSSIGFE